MSASNAGDLGSTPGSGRSPGEGNATHSSTLAWRIPWTEEPGGLQSVGVAKESDTTEGVNSCSGRSKLIQHGSGITQRAISLGLAFPHVQTG